VREIAELTGQLVAIDSVNPDLVPGGAGEGAIARFVAGWLERAGLEVELDEAAPGRPNVIGVARGTGGGRALLLNAHMDTVGVAGMERPFAPYVAGNRLYGRGACDMKASLAAIMLVGAAMRQRQVRGDVIVTAVVDEEYASIGTQSVVGRWRADAAVVTEPTGLDLCVAHKGFAWIDVETAGVAAHGSRPDLGVDAIAKMGQVLVGLEDLDRSLRAAPGHPLLGRGSLHASLISGGQELSSYPERCRLSVERRTAPGETARAVAAQVQGLLDRLAASDPAFRATMATTLVCDPFAVAAVEPIVIELRRQADVVLGHAPAFVGSAGWMDAAILSAAGIPAVIFGPGGEGLHAVVEWVDLGQAERCRTILLATATAFCV
jgi:acetylornithine deacetylase